MNNEVIEIKDQFRFNEYVKKMSAYNEALGLMFWDLRTGAPKNGAEQRSEVIGMLSSDLFEMSTSNEMAAYLAKLSPEMDQLDRNDTKTIRRVSKRVRPK